MFYVAEAHCDTQKNFAIFIPVMDNWDNWTSWNILLPHDAMHPQY